MLGAQRHGGALPGDGPTGANSQLAVSRARLRKAVAAVIAATRRDRDFTQPELASRLGWSRDTLSKMEAGRRRVEFGDLVLIAHALGERTEVIIRRILAWSG